MKILVVDDGQLAINSLIRILCRVARTVTISVP